MAGTNLKTETLKIENISEELALEVLQTIPFEAKSFHINFAVRGLEHGSYSLDKNGINEFRQKNVVPFLEVQLKYRNIVGGEETPFYSEVRGREIGDSVSFHTPYEARKYVKEVSAEIFLRGGKPHLLNISNVLSNGHEVENPEKFYDILKEKWFRVLNENGYVPSSARIVFGSKNHSGFELNLSRRKEERNLELAVDQNYYKYGGKIPVEPKNRIELAEKWFYALNK